MELKISEEKDNPLLHRKEVIAEITFDKATPSNAEVSKELADKLKAKEELIVIKKIAGGFGSTSAKVTAYVYADKEQKERVEPKIKVKEVKK